MALPKATNHATKTSAYSAKLSGRSPALTWAPATFPSTKWVAVKQAHSKIASWAARFALVLKRPCREPTRPATWRNTGLSHKSSLTSWNGDTEITRGEPLKRSARLVDLALFAHGHILRIRAARRLELPADCGGRFALGTGAIGILGYERDVRVITRWNIDGSSSMTSV
jgi:hypothetical protein